MDSKKIDIATDLLEDCRRLNQKLAEANTEEGVRSRELSLAITQIETGKLWLQEVLAHLIHGTP
jgi:hypothetical protein